MGQAEYIRLNSYLDKMLGTPFEWGVHDCFTFTNGAFKSMYGVGYADDWEGMYMQSNGVHPKGPRSMRDDFGFSNLYEGLSTKLTRVERPTFGSLVTTKKGCRWITGVALGISIGSRAVFLNREGLIRLNIEDVESAWVCR